MQRLNTLNKTYESGEILSSDNLNLIINYINQSINAINELMINNDVSVGHYEIRYKDSLSEPSPPSTGSSGLSDGWKRSIDSAVYNIWMTLCFVTIGNTYGTWTKAIKISAKDGSNGSFTLEVYRNDSAAAVDSVYIPEVIDNSYSSPAFPPIGWTTAVLTRTEGEYTWCILRTISFNENNDPIYGKWSVPFRLTGDNGKDGEDGKYLEYIYKRFTSKQTWQQIDSNPANWSISDTSFDILSGQENHVNPQREDYTGPSELGWTDNPQGVTDIYKYEYVCQRIYNGTSYEAFTSPVIWSKYGDKGRDGDGYEYIFKGGPTYGTHPNQINNPDPSSIGQTKNDDDFVPDGWSDDPVTLTEQLLYVWVSTRKRKGGESWSNFSDPKIWAHWADQGANGGHWEFIYINSQNTPTKPSDGTSLSNLPSGWTITPSTPDVANGYYTWMSQCFVSGEGAYSIWTSPVRITGGDGDNGADGSDVEFIYTRRTSLWINPTAPVASGSGNNRNFSGNDWYGLDSAGVTWYDNPQGVTKDIMYEYVSQRLKPAGKNQPWGAYSTPVIWSKWGEKGLDGDGVEYIYYANTTGSIPSGQYPNEWAANQTSEYKGPDGSLWKYDPIDLSTLGQGAKQWISKRKKTTTNGVVSWSKFSEPALWSTYAKDGIVDGYTVDLTNENMPVGTDSSGNVSNYSNVCGVQVFHNGVEETNFTISTGTITRSDNVDPGNSITATPNNTNKTITVAISNISNFSAVNAYVPVIVTITSLSGTITRNLTISLFGIATGEAGAAIDLFTSTSAIRCDYERTTSTPSTLSVGVKVSSPTSGVHKYNAGSTEAEGMGMAFGYFYNGDSVSEQTISSSSISLSSKIGGTNITDITVVMRYNNVIVDSETIPFVSDGAPGEYYAQLLSGVIMRTKSWNSIDNSEMIEDGTTVSSDGVTYLDVVEYNNSYYKIKTRTLKVNATVPESSGVVDDTHWSIFAPSGKALFNAMIANSAFISNLTAKEVVITENNNPVAGLTGGTAQTGDAFTRGDVRIWAGNPIVNGTANLINCPFYVTNAGLLHAEGASITGTFTSSSDLARIIINTLTRTEQYNPNAVLNTVSSSILMQAYNNMTYDEIIHNEGEENEYYDYEVKKTTNSLLVDVLTIGVNEVLLVDNGLILDVGYDGMIRINSTAGSGRVATFSPENISCYDGYGAGASLSYGTIRASGFSKKLSADEKISYTLDSNFIPNGASKYTLSMGFSSSGGSGSLLITTESAPYANTSTTLSGSYGASTLVLSETIYNSSSNEKTSEVYTQLVADKLDSRLEFDDGTIAGRVVIGMSGISIGNNWSINWATFIQKMNSI